MSRSTTEHEAYMAALRRGELPVAAQTELTEYGNAGLRAHLIEGAVVTGLLASLMLSPFAFSALSDRSVAALVALAVGITFFGALFSVYALRRRQIYRRLLQDVKKERVNSIEAELNWAGYHYHIEPDEALPKLTQRESRALDHVLPGRYTIYSLPVSGHIVGLSSISSLQEVLSRLKTTLEKAQGFQEIELVENRAGRMSQPQKRRFFRAGSAWAALAAVALLAPAFLGTRAASVEAPGSSWVLAPMAIGFGALSCWVAARMFLDARAGKAHRLTCTLDNFRNASSGYIVAYADGRKVPVSRRTFSAMPAMNFALYYAPRSKRLLSVEALDIPAIDKANAEPS